MTSSHCQSRGLEPESFGPAWGAVVSPPVSWPLGGRDRLGVMEGDTWGGCRAGATGGSTWGFMPTRGLGRPRRERGRTPDKAAVPMGKNLLGPGEGLVPLGAWQWTSVWGRVRDSEEAGLWAQAEPGFQQESTCQLPSHLAVSVLTSKQLK